MRRWRIRSSTISPMILHVIIIRVRMRKGQSNPWRWSRGWSGQSFRKITWLEAGGRVLFAEEVPFIKDSSLRDDYLLCLRIVELPALVARWIPNKHTLLHVGSQIPQDPLVLLDVDIGSATPDPESRHIWLDTIEGLIGGLVGNSRGGSPVPDMHKGTESLSPEAGRETSLIEHGDDGLLNGPVGTLCNSILLRPVPGGVLPVDPILGTEVKKLVGHVLPTLVSPESLDGRSSQIFSPCLEVLEGREGPRLLLQRIDCPEPPRVINEGDPVPEARGGLDLEGTMEV
jgi:hypothetical protein